MRFFRFPTILSLLFAVWASVAQADANQEQTLQKLTSQRNALAAFDLSSLEGEAESIAFWINAYNFFMLNKILTDRPDGNLVESVWDYGGRVNPFVDNVFEREKFVIDGEKYSLNQMEKEICWVRTMQKGAGKMPGFTLRSTVLPLAALRGREYPPGLFNRPPPEG